MDFLQQGQQMQAKDRIWCSGKETEPFPKLEEKLIVQSFLRDSTGFTVEPPKGIFKSNLDYTKFSTRTRDLEPKLE